MIDVVVPIFIKTDKQLAITTQCLLTAKKSTAVPYRTIIVETGSDYFKDYADIHIYEKEKSTATKSFNRGFALTESERVVLLTNDVIVKDGWVEALDDCFRLPDCGLSTLATTQLHHIREPRIAEGVWFSVAMIPKKYARFDENYANSWDDTDLIMRVYLDGLKMYRNYGVVVDHLTGMTQYADPKHIENFNRNRDIFLEKYKKHADHRMFKILTEGRVI